MSNFKGTACAVITPFTSTNQVDVEALERVINYQVDNGINYLVVLGTTGESVTLSKAEKLVVVETFKKTVNGRVPLVLGMGGNNTQAIIDEIQNTDLSGIDGLLSVAPYYNKPTQNGLIAHFNAIASSTSVPIVLYNVPGRTSSNILPETALQIAAANKNVVAIKEASGSFEQNMALIQGKNRDFTIVSGDDALTLPLLSVGVEGVISVIAQAYPKQFSEMINLGLAGDFEKARLIHYSLLNITNLIFAEGNPAGIKYVLHKMGMIENVLRLPLIPVSGALAKKLDEAMERLQ